MAPRRVNPYRVKVNRSYSTAELARLLGVHKNTVRNWQREGLTAIDDRSPTIFQGRAVRAFLIERQARRKRPCPPGMLYCFRCREPREPALGMVEFVEQTSGIGNLRAICGSCESLMHRRARNDALEAVMPGIAVQLTKGPQRLGGRPNPSLNCAEGDQGTK